MSSNSISRRSFIAAVAATSIFTVTPLATAQNFKSRFNKLRNEVLPAMVATNYPDEVDRMSDEDFVDMKDTLSDVAGSIARAPSNVIDHMLTEWTPRGQNQEPRADRRHTSECPYCLSVARSIESRFPQLRAVPDILPTRFLINGAPFIVNKATGLLHQWLGNRINPTPAGYLWFNNGQYIGIDFQRNAVLAQPVG